MKEQETDMRSNLTARYAATQGMYWMIFSIAVNYAAVYLQGFGYSNTSIGIIVAVGNILGVLAGPMAVSLSETRIRLSSLSYILMCVQGILLLAMQVISRKCLALSICFSLFLAVCMTMNSMMLAMYTTCSRRGIHVDYAFARGIGSACFVISSASLGVVAQNVSPTIIPVIGFALVVIQLLMNRVLLTRMECLGAFRDEHKCDGTASGNTSLMAFVSRNRKYSMMLLMSILVFIGHNSVYNFYINVMRNVGGDASMMGFITAYMGLVEVPVMLLYGRFSKGMKEGRLLKFAFVFFAIKGLGFALARSIPMLFVAQTMQVFSYAIYASAIVPYSLKVLPTEDATRGQSLAYSMTVVGSVLSSVIAGPLFDRTSVSVVLWVATAFCAVGAVGCCMCIDGDR